MLIAAPALEDTRLVRAAFTTRCGGLSGGVYRTLNLAYTVGDASDAVAANRRRLAAMLGVAAGRLAEAEQVHGNGVAVPDGPGSPRSDVDGAPVPGVDALTTDAAGLWLAVYAADCVPVLVLDPDRPAIAAAHAGWRGVAAGIVPATLDRMRGAFATDPARCIVVLGPAIGGCCYEVDAPVARAMEAAPWWPLAAPPSGPGRWKLDLRAAIRHQLYSLGVPMERVTALPYCTACRPDLFFSYRRDGVTGRMGAYISLRAPAG
jgi:purine-nucleoside/S-methyl-5'-thioadenosine phosphorylase / adenosine deaminase